MEYVSVVTTYEQEKNDEGEWVETGEIGAVVVFKHYEDAVEYSDMRRLRSDVWTMPVVS